MNLFKEYAMRQTTPNTMRAAAIDRFGGIETLTLQTLPVPEVGPDEILIRVESAGVGAWDPFEREGGFARRFGTGEKFPYVLGTDGAGTLVQVGDRLTGVKEGAREYATVLATPKEGSDPEVAAVKADNVSPVPDKLTTEQAGVMPSDALTALQGLDDMLGLKPGETLLIFGAGGGIGHLAVQLARRMGARVLALASGEDGVALARRLGADVVVNGRKADVVAAARAFALAGLDAALVTAGGETTDRALAALRAGGRVAYPHGVAPEPKVRPSVRVSNYDVSIDGEAIAKLNRLIEAGPFEVHVAHTFPFDQAAAAQRALAEHYLGKLALRPR